MSYCLAAVKTKLPCKRPVIWISDSETSDSSSCTSTNTSSVVDVGAPDLREVVSNLYQKLTKKTKASYYVF